MKKTVSVIIPAYNESANISELRDRLALISDRLSEKNYLVQVLIVDDHSRDETSEMIRSWIDEDPMVRMIRLSRNFGSYSAILAGLDTCGGDCAVIMAADLQDPPEYIPNLVEKWEEGADVVWATRAAREGIPLSEKLTAGLYYWIMRKIALPQMHKQGADFLLIDRKVVEAYKQFPEKNTNILALFHWMGFNQETIEYTKEKRHGGESKWTLSKKLKLFLDSVISFSYVPIRLMSLFGACLSLLGMLYAVHVVVYYLVGNDVAGWSSLMVVILVIGGFQMLMLGLLGEYLWRTLDESRGRPRYLIEEYVSAPVTRIREAAHA